MASVSVSLCSEQGLCFCKATKQADGRYEVEVDYVELERGGIDGSVLLRAVRAAPLLSKYTRVVAVPHPGFSNESTCSRHLNVLLAALTAVYPHVRVEHVTHRERMVGCEGASGRDVEEEALRAVTGGNNNLRFEAQGFGSPLNRDLFKHQTSFMRDEAAKFLQDPAKCANSAAAYASYTAASLHPAAFLFDGGPLECSVHGS